MRDDFIDRKIRKMAEAERMAVPESLDAKVENILDGLETEKKDSKNTDGKRVNQTVRHYGFRRIVIPAAACLLLASVTVTASGLYRARMESMNHEKLETYFSGLQEADVAADSYSRPLTDGEKNRLEELRQAYLEEGYFPQKELAMLDSPEKYKKGVAFYAARSTFFLPEEEMTEEELLELIDFREKRDYSLAKITEEIEAGDYEYVKTEDSALPGDMSQESGSQQTQGAGEASVVPGQIRQHKNGRSPMRENSVSGVLWRQNRGCMSVGSPWKGKHGWNIWLTAAGPRKSFMMISMRTARCIACASHRTEVSMRHCADWHLRERNMAGCL